VQRLQRTRRIKSNNVALRDFDYHAPSKQLDSDAQVEQQSLGGIPLEYYDYAAGYRDPEQGERLARLRLEAIQADAHALGGEANARALAVGRAFTLVGHPALSRNRRYYVTNSELTFIQDGPDSTSQGRNVAVKFRALADDQPFRPLLVTKRPRVPGIQSATVVGPEMSEVHTDKLGRIRVHFHWDRYKTTEADASCWIRVTQAWAGKGWGVLAMPRVGQEVIVVYVDGDLDRPLATGIVYNGENPTPYDLPKDIRYTGLVTRSIKRAGGIPNASQLTFDDQHGAERVMIHAERDLQQTVERNSSTSIAQDLNLSVKGTSTSVVGVDTSFTGVSTGFKGVDTSFTGVATSMVGVSTSITGSSNSVTGVSNSMTGISSSWKDVSMSTTGQSESITGVSLSYTGTSNSMTGTSTSVTGTSTSITGTSMSNTGSSTSITGTSMSTTGSSVSTTGSSMSATGSSVGTTGSSVSTTGSKMSVTGFSFSYTGASYEDVGVDLKKLGMQTKN
ncbi:type VI secretion system Vgr family protein, partial [Burkholderia pseudomallei]|uniref:type VI secretion system Vgr family protein n=1 Tax=Burkholderia pseudomallei TaxID=28450 RepID=UPI000F074A33